MYINRRLYYVYLEYLFNKIKGFLKNKINEKKNDNDKSVLDII